VSPAAGRRLGPLERTLRERRAAGRKLLVPYVTGGFREWRAALEAVAAAGADAIEVGLPFSDPVMDGPVIQEASVRALAGGATPQAILAGLAGADLGGTPVAVMTYYNLIARNGLRRSASELAEAGVSAAILPDLPLEELDPWQAAAEEAGIETVLLAAPTTPEARLRRIAERAGGFLYAVGVMGVTGERAGLAPSAAEIARRCKELTDVPVLVGVGISTPEQAVEVCQVADGVVVGSALMRRLLDGEGPEGAAGLVSAFRDALAALSVR
jgi:tryptophan synthase alpha chain